MCGDKTVVWYPHRTVCFKDRERKVADRTYRALYDEKPWHDGTGAKWSKEFSRETPFRFDDGVVISVTPTDESPGATFLTKRQA